MPKTKILSDAEVRRLPPMLFGSIRWNKGLGAPVGSPCSGFKVVVDEHTVSQFRIGPSGPEVVPNTGIWVNVQRTAPCSAAPDQADTHVVNFSVPDVHLNGFPDGKYRVAVELTGNWSESRLQTMLGFKRIDPLSWYVSLTKDHHIVKLDFEVVHEPWRLRL